ncbi:hypothetical protein OH76DRAFT_1408582 [Lentinus brumalis]|uniref:Uncharacterized protein n=1 Tax=Lentinus brumalis TaxID=2498619 RepID=A0A371CXG4_9APHY|nr:hypothetical protein OH76DRAFT_1408582 [Polyporus brumalis]
MPTFHPTPRLALSPLLPTTVRRSTVLLTTTHPPTILSTLLVSQAAPIRLRHRPTLLTTPNLSGDIQVFTSKNSRVV